jgi:malate synthase
MKLLRRQLLSPRYVQHSARVLFLVGQADPALHDQMLEAIFDLPRDEVARRVKSGAMHPSALDAHDYALDVTRGA